MKRAVRVSGLEMPGGDSRSGSVGLLQLRHQHLNLRQDLPLRQRPRRRGVLPPIGAIRLAISSPFRIP